MTHPLHYSVVRPSAALPALSRFDAVPARGSGPSTPRHLRAVPPRAVPRQRGSAAPSSAGTSSAETTATFTGLLACSAAVTSHLVGVAAGRPALEATISRELPTGTQVSPSLLRAATDQAFAAVQARAGLVIVLSLVVAILLLVGRRGGVGPRAFAVLFMGLTSVVVVLGVMETFSLLPQVLGGLALALFPVTTVALFWQPRVQRR